MSVAQTPPVIHLPVSWEEIRRDSVALADKVRARGPWQGIVAVARGGLVPAALVARALGLRCVETVSVASYEREKLGTPTLIKTPVAAGDGAGWLVIDDLVDTGTTMTLIRDLLPKAHVGVLYAKPAGRALAHDFIREF